MRRLKPSTRRNKIDVADDRQIRILRRRLGVSSAAPSSLIGVPAPV